MSLSGRAGDEAHLVGHFAKLAAYNKWANECTYKAVTELPEADVHRDVGLFFGSIHKTLNHLLIADRIWLFRLTGAEREEGPIDRVLHGPLEELTRAREMTDERIVRMVDGLDATQLSKMLSFRTSTGLDIEAPTSAILAHLFNHQTHHRGQVHAAITILGGESVELDLLLFDVAAARRGRSR